MDSEGKSLLELVPRNELYVNQMDPTGAGAESLRCLVNAKLLEEALRRVETKTLLVLVPSAEVRELLGPVSNDLWDLALVLGIRVDSRVIVSKPGNIRNAIKTVLNAGKVLHPKCISSDEHPNVVDLHTALLDELPVVRWVCLGGTFDRMHQGHKKILLVAFSVATEHVLVGVTSQSMLKTKAGYDLIDTVERRCANVESFFRSVVPETSRLKLTVVVLDDPWGPAIVSPEFEGIVVSSETIKGAHAINAKRTAKGMDPLIPIVVMRSQQYTLSSTFVRNMQGQL